MKCKVRGSSSNYFDTLVTYTFEFDGTNMGFSARTRLETEGDLPREDLLFWVEYPGMVDIINLPISDAADIREEFWPIFFALDGEGQPTALLDAATIISNIQASEYLNNGWELVGNETKGYALYEDGSDMQRPYMWFGIEFPLYFLFQDNT